MTQLPSKITPDAIREALFELRFEHSELSEVIIGKIAGNRRWTNFTKIRLPTAEVPEQLRAIDPNLRFLPSIELRGPGGNEVVRVGANAVSHHIVGAYIGWDSFLPKLSDTVADIFEEVPG